MILNVWLAILPKFFLFEGSVSTESPGVEAHVMWMRDWPIPWHLESLIYLDLFAGMFLQTRLGLRYIPSFIYSRFDEAD